MKILKPEAARLNVLGALVSASLVAAIMLGWGVWGMQNAVVPDRVALFAQLMNTPVILIAPIFGVLAGAAGSVVLVGQRAIANYWPRTSMRRLLTRHTVTAFGLPFTVFFSLSAALLWFAFEIWPSLQPQLIDDEPFSFGPDGAPLAAAPDFNFSGLLASGDWTLGVVVCLLFAAQMGAYALLAHGLLLATGHTFVALVAPLVVHILQTVAVSLAGAPTAALLYVSTPFSLRATSEAFPLIALGALIAAALAINLFVIARHRSLRTLQ